MKTSHTDHKHILITGGSGGIGIELIRVFAQASDHVTFTYRPGEDSRRRALDLVERFRDYRVEALPLDVGDPQSHAQLMQSLTEPVDVMIHNAGVGTKTVERAASTYKGQDEAFFRVNAIGPLWLSEDLLPRMQEKGRGKILFVSSVDGGITHFPRFRAADGMSKAAVAFLGRQLAATLAYTGIDVFTVCPGATDTPMFQASTLQGLSPEQRQSLETSLPGGRLIEPREIADLCFYLCRDEARILRGAVIDASLGLGVCPAVMS
ncbi:MULTISPECIES: SDR family oxidoreductase [Ralstonia solanacearum species complex]|uniref:KR domain-containing protein n=4 Tax=Ralstonia solanacearum species complex TaxID=3116862 RepID=A0A0K1ZS44_RALSL|nr:MULTISPECIES: SDR family oxidoreductase [Ralstonia]AKZ28692.1 alcohol dehydrogenase [Ralstonia solanacearum]APF89268.1 alcohol dehydrogenase [Ralstonia solanacearum FJAT-1458]AGH87030.1 Oxidoreductase, short-chain dehydrogenase/reductase family [Ralstonia pseudosolanacearum FQY_4]ANH35828.1 alcohol dehydrogenase [Ralstonia solanacearum]ARU24817.1 glutathione S-transferase [Ralstonia solanacearum]